MTLSQVYENLKADLRTGRPETYLRKRVSSGTHLNSPYTPFLEGMGGRAAFRPALVLFVLISSLFLATARSLNGPRHQVALATPGSASPTIVSRGARRVRDGARREGDASRPRAPLSSEPHLLNPVVRPPTPGVGSFTNEPPVWHLPVLVQPVGIATRGGARSSSLLPATATLIRGPIFVTVHQARPHPLPPCHLQRLPHHTYPAQCCVSLPRI